MINKIHKLNICILVYHKLEAQNITQLNSNMTHFNNNINLQWHITKNIL